MQEDFKVMQRKYLIKLQVLLHSSNQVQTFYDLAGFSIDWSWSHYMQWKKYVPGWNKNIKYKENNSIHYVFYLFEMWLPL